MAQRRSPRHERSKKRRTAPKSAPLVQGAVRLQRILAAAGVDSRRGAERFLKEGRVTVNGRTAGLGDSADPAVDQVALDGERLTLRAPTYWLFNKPTGVVSTRRDPEGRPTIIDLLPEVAKVLFPVGRLDVNTSGLMLLTNDGAMMQRLLHPSTGSEKIYRVTVKGELDRKKVARLERGVELEDGRTKPARVESLSYDTDRQISSFQLTLTEGRKRQIRRSMLALGHPVKRLVRVQIGPLRLGRLRRGEARPLRPGELEALRAYVERLNQGSRKSAQTSAPRKGRRT